VEAASSWEAAELLGGVPSAAQRAEAQNVGWISDKCWKGHGIHIFFDFCWLICGLYWQLVWPELLFIDVMAGNSMICLSFDPYY
jgi:hypothetical protein